MCLFSRYYSCLFFPQGTESKESFYDKIGSYGQVPEVVDAYVHALLGRYPRARYVVGKDAKYLWLVLQWVPEWLSDWLLFKFDPNQPLPAALLKKDQ